ncbi:RHS repeat-associated core domain-containing protein [Sneathiella aquimaris]|uniref:RHS repeat-associated core domain-containing protein n=1 Tax=Sneathiella aquimaris TaxID=2599305 RepID=UPI00146C3C2F|nr:RHS repeat-associated core domain-containing protein [Sneathiella aquimaris]
MKRTETLPCRFKALIKAMLLSAGLSCLVMGTGVYANTTQTVTAETILDFEPSLIGKKLDEELSLILKLRPHIKLPPEQGSTLEREDAQFYVTVDRYRGMPEARFPIGIAPGTNGLQPDLKIRIAKSEVDQNAGFEVALTHPESITQCGQGGKYCLGNVPLIPVTGAKSGTLYSLPNDPRILLQKSDVGFLLKDGNGLRQYYTAPTMDTLETGPWEINTIFDRFENFVLYRYDAKTGAISTIYYGQDKAEKRNLRAVHLTYDDKNPERLIGLTSSVAEKLVRAYQLTYSRSGMLSTLSECAQGEGKSLSCFAPYEFSWTKEGGLLSAVQNGRGGETEFTYGKTKSGPVLSSLVLKDQGRFMGVENYLFEKPQIKEGKRVGFGLAKSYPADGGIGSLTEFGEGETAGILVKETVADVTFEDGDPAPVFQPLSDETYVYAPHKAAHVTSTLLKETIAQQYNPSGQITTMLTHKRKYDAKGRIVSITTEEGEHSFTYLDQVALRPVAEDAGNLLVSRQFKSAETSEVSTKEWAYRFDGDLLTGSTITGTRAGQVLENKTSSQELDRHGNIIVARQGNTETRIKYDDAFKTFPVSVEMQEGKTLTSAFLEYDAGTGRVIKEVLPNGSRTQLILDAAGLEVGQRVDIADPRKASSSKVSIVKEVTKETLANGYLRVLNNVKMFSEDDQLLLTKRAEKVTDSLGRVVKISGQEIGPDGTQRSESYLENAYSPQGQVTRVMDEAGRFQEITYNREGKIIREVKEGYGDTSFDYNKQGLVSEISRADETLFLEYDDQNRLKRKTLPNRKFYEFTYSNQHPQKIGKAILPEGHEVEFLYSTKGLVTEKTVRFPVSDEEFLSFTLLYDYQNDQLKTVTYPDGSKISYTYEGSRLARINWLEQAPDGWGRLDKPIIEYRPEISEDGTKKLSRFLGNEVVETYQWGNDGKITEIVTYRGEQDPEQVFSRLAYDFKPGTDLVSEENRYLKERKTVRHAKRDYTYTEDQRLKTYKDTIDGRVVARQSFDRFNHRTEIRQRDPESVNVSGQETGINYDKFGNINQLTRRGEVREFLFDIENNLLKSNLRSGGVSAVTEFVYDHTGQRLEKRAEEGSTTFYVDPFYEVSLLDEGRMQATRYVWDYMGRVAAFTKILEEDDFAGFAPASGNETHGTFQHQLSTLIDKAIAAGSSHLNTGLMMLLGIFSIAIFSLAVFERVTDRSNRVVFPMSSSRRNPAMTIVSSFVMASFLMAILTPAAHAALEGGDGTPKAAHSVYFHYDIRGSVISVSDEAGHQTASVFYHPYGMIQDNGLTGGNNNFRFKFAGLEYDTETQLINGGARLLDPTIGKYLSIDPARATKDAYAYTSGDPVNFVDRDGRMESPTYAMDIEAGRSALPSRPDPILQGVELEVKSNASDGSLEEQAMADPQIVRLREVSLSDDGGDVLPAPENWVRYPSFWSWTFGILPGAQAPEVGPAPVGDEPDAQDKAAYDRIAQSGYMQGWTRTGGYLQSLLGSALLAWWFPTSYTFSDGNVVTPGFFKDLGLYAMTVTAFSAYGKGYTANEAYYWKGIAERGATSKDYLSASLRRMFWKVSVQLVAFTAITYLARWARGFPMVSDGMNDFGEEIGWRLLRTFVFSFLGSAALLPYYLMTKAPNPTYDQNMTEEDLAAMPWWRRTIIKASIAYRKFNARGGFFARHFEPGSWNARLQSLWYPAYVMQMYAWYLVGSAGYYGGLAAIFPALPNHDWADFRTAWLRNLALIILAPAASPLAYINAWSRKSFTIIKQRSSANPRTSGFWFRALGPVQGLRLAKFDDRAFLPTDEWMAILRQHEVQWDGQYGHSDAGSDAEVSSDGGQGPGVERSGENSESESVTQPVSESRHSSEWSDRAEGPAIERPSVPGTID